MCVLRISFHPILHPCLFDEWNLAWIYIPLLKLGYNDERNVKADYIHYQWLERRKQRNQDVVIERVKRPHQEEDSERQLSADHDLVSCVAERLVQSVGCQTDIRKDSEKEAEDAAKRQTRTEE